MENEYRIVEQFGAFRIEEKRESEHHLDAISLLVLLITRRKIPKYTYWVSSVNKSFSTKQEAIDFYDSKQWEKMTDYELVKFQLYNDFLAVPFGRFHSAVESVLGRPVFTHEFADTQYLQREFEKIKP